MASRRLPVLRGVIAEALAKQPWQPLRCRIARVAVFRSDTLRPHACAVLIGTLPLVNYRFPQRHAAASCMLQPDMDAQDGHSDELESKVTTCRTREIARFLWASRAAATMFPFIACGAHHDHRA